MQYGSKSSMVILLLILSLVPLGFSEFVRPVQASFSGLVCLATVKSSPPPDPCSGSFVFNGPVTSPAELLRVGVYIYNSSGLNGFDITLLADSTVLKPAGVDLTGTVLSPNPTTILECLSGVNITGGICPSTDTVDTLHLAAVAFSLTASPTTGLLFTAIYNITRTTTSSGISIGFQTGCNPVSSSDATYCVAITSGVVGTVAETVQGAMFDNSSPPPYLTLISSSSVIGPMILGSQDGLRLNLTGQNGWSNAAESCPCPASLTVVANNTVTVRLNATSVMVPPAGSTFVGMNVTGGVGGNFTVTVFAHYQVLDLNNFNTDTLVAVANVQVIVSDFSLTANPANISSALAGITGDSAISVVGYNGFSGSVHLSETSTAGQCNLSSSTVSLPGSASSQLGCTDPSAGNFNATVTGVSSGISHSVSVSFVVQDFTVSVTSSPIVLSAGSSKNVTLIVTGINGFDQLVTMSLTTPTGVTIMPIATSFLVPGSVILTLTGNAVANYTVHVTFGYSGLAHTTSFQVQVAPATSASTGTILGLSPVLFYSLIAGLGVIAAVSGIIVLSKRKTPGKVAAASARKSRAKKGPSMLSELLL